LWKVPQVKGSPKLTVENSTVNQPDVTVGGFLTSETNNSNNSQAPTCVREFTPDSGWSRGAMEFRELFIHEYKKMFFYIINIRVSAFFLRFE
jgi:hypothetical protein